MCRPTLTATTVELATAPPLTGTNPKPVGGVGEATGEDDGLGEGEGDMSGDGVADGVVVGEAPGEGFNPVAEPHALSRATLTVASNSLFMRTMSDDALTGNRANSPVP